MKINFKKLSSLQRFYILQFENLHIEKLQIFAGSDLSGFCRSLHLYLSFAQKNSLQNLRPNFLGIGLILKVPFF